MMQTDPSIFAMVCEQRDAMARELAAYRAVVVPKPDYDRAVAERDQYSRAIDELTQQLVNAADGRAALQLTGLVADVSALMRLLDKYTWAPDELPTVHAVMARLVENGARLHGDEAVYAAAEAHGTAVRR